MVSLFRKRKEREYLLIFVTNSTSDVSFFVLLTVASSAFGGLADFNCGSLPGLAHYK